MSRISLALLLTVVSVGTAHGQNLISFHPAVTYAVDGTPAGGALLDFNGDGFLDLVVSSDHPNKLECFANEGDGTFAAPFQVPMGNATGPEGIAVGDFNGDTHLDLVVALFGANAVQLVYGNGAGQFTPGPTSAVGVEPSTMVAADFNGDGHIDAAVNNRISGSMSVLLNNGTGGLQSAVSYPVGLETRCIAVGDFNHDGKPDLAVSARDSRIIRLFANAGGGAFQVFRDLSMGNSLKPQAIAFADLDRDGTLDLATASSGTTPGQEHPSVFLQSNGGRPNVWVGPVNGQTLPGISPTGIALADFDLDGRIDVATANAGTNNVSANRNGGLGIFTIPNVFPVGSNPETQALLVGDLDRNGSPDLVTLNQDSEDLSVLLNTLAGTLAAEGPVAVRRPLLHAAAPNPLASSTTLAFDLPFETDVQLSIYDLAGRSVRTLERGSFPAGRHRTSWDGTSDRGDRLPAGIYLTRLQAGSHIQTQRLVLTQ